MEGKCLTRRTNNRNVLQTSTFQVFLDKNGFGIWELEGLERFVYQNMHSEGGGPSLGFDSKLTGEARDTFE